MMLNLLITFSLSLMLLIVSANFLLKFIDRFSGKIKISPLIIGATIIAVGTSLPETSVAISSIALNATNISFGDIIGSNIANICLILGLGILLFPVRIGTEKTQRNNIVMILSTAFFIFLLFLPVDIRKGLAVFSIFAYTAFLIIETVWGEAGKKAEDRKALTKLSTRGGNPFAYFIGILLSLAGLLASSRFLVSSIISFSKIFGISEEIIGLSVVAVGTSLPELATTIASGINKDYKLLYGDIQGSNIYNVAIIGSILLIANKLDIRIATFSLIILSISTLGIILLSNKYKGAHIPRIYGLLFIILYSFYIWRIYNPGSLFQFF